MKSDDIIKYNVQIEISNIIIDDEYYSFDYKYKVNQDEWLEKKYDGDHSRRYDKEKFLWEIQNGYGYSLILDEISFN